METVYQTVKCPRCGTVVQRGANTQEELNAVIECAKYSCCKHLKYPIPEHGEMWAIGEIKKPRNRHWVY